jgi:hypothetical protein
MSKGGETSPLERPCARHESVELRPELRCRLPHGPRAFLMLDNVLRSQYRPGRGVRVLAQLLVDRREPATVLLRVVGQHSGLHPGEFGSPTNFEMVCGLLRR